MCQHLTVTVDGTHFDASVTTETLIVRKIRNFLKVKVTYGIGISGVIRSSSNIHTTNRQTENIKTISPAEQDNNIVYICTKRIIVAAYVSDNLYTQQCKLLQTDFWSLLCMSWLYKVVKNTL